MVFVDVKNVKLTLVGLLPPLSRTLRDGFGQDVPDERVMLRLLEEELCAYKEVAGDTAQERYNTLCDLLDICHEESSRTHLRAVYLCEMAQVVCYQDFSEQTEWYEKFSRERCSLEPVSVCCVRVHDVPLWPRSTPIDFTHEALRLLEEEPETPENAERLKDDKAHALLWHYICTLENTLQEVSSVRISWFICIIGKKNVYPWC